MLAEELDLLYRETWNIASSAERLALAGAADLGPEASPVEIFSAIPRATRPMPPMFSRLLWPELSPEEITRTELADVPLSASVARELGERIDRAIARLGGGELEVISQGRLEAAADAEGVHWQVLSYALSRESEAGSSD